MDSCYSSLRSLVVGGSLVVYMGGEARQVGLGKDGCGEQKACF